MEGGSKVVEPAATSTAETVRVSDGRRREPFSSEVNASMRLNLDADERMEAARRKCEILMNVYLDSDEETAKACQRRPDTLGKSKKNKRRFSSKPTKRCLP